VIDRYGRMLKSEREKQREIDRMGKKAVEGKINVKAEFQKIEL